ncbi:MAG: substrate-binding domain-containing protein [Proteobacteria bacterium]|nr:substrate-binding domain-containing protein [Pseudomonadota bacterium]
MPWSRTSIGHACLVAFLLLQGIAAAAAPDPALVERLAASPGAASALSSQCSPPPGGADGRDKIAEQAIEQFPDYDAPTRRVTGTIRLWGHGSAKRDFMGDLVRAWIEAFHRRQPDVRFDYRMYGTASAVGALYTGAGDIALLGEEISPAAARAFRRAKGYAPTEIEVATGSVDTNYFDYAHMIFVHADNPVECLSLRQLDAIFGEQHKRGDRNIRDWSQLGLGDDWARHRITPYSWKTDEDFGLFFRERVLENSHRWNPDVREYVHGTHADGSQCDQGQRILDALAEDRYGIAISNVRYARPGVKAVALAWQDGGPWTHATTSSLIDRSYPLVRIIPAIVDQPPGRKLAPAIEEFLRFVLSREGQSLLVEHSDYLPLNRRARDTQIGKLK